MLGFNVEIALPHIRLFHFCGKNLRSRISAG